jgi:hypothetical protein
LEVICRGRGSFNWSRSDQTNKGQYRANYDDETDQIDDTVHASLLSLERELAKPLLVPQNRAGV